MPLKPGGVKYAFFCRRPHNQHGARQYPIVSRYNAHYHAAAGHQKYEKTHTKYKYEISDITESRIKKNENSLTAERWLFSQIKASRPFVGQYICHCILSPIVWIRKSAMYVPYVQLNVHNIAVSVFYCLSSVQCQATAANDWSQGLFLKSRLLFSVETCLRHSKSQHEEK